MTATRQSQLVQQPASLKGPSSHFPQPNLDAVLDLDLLPRGIGSVEEIHCRVSMLFATRAEARNAAVPLWGTGDPRLL
jgi:hypothetical protein